ncbi:hydroxymethylglutaryl-CoA lyase [Acuticoccus kandeliae]|uniref:hydroxymethylglutaryl-CoA lyase n=1 Tax=Acuticoccus kandeliae TaxID=2073160 RepID=UPI000D3EA7A1|nr:hydroxymethylglutaryl-CoA lyase [Acuticoccus kandeliae]
MTTARSVDIVEVAPRDGFQSINEPLPTGEKIAIIEDLLGAGVKRMELGSFVSPKAIPQMGDMADIAAHFRGRPGVRLSVLVPNARGAEIALRHGYPELVFVLSVSEAHNLNNVRQTVAQSLDQLRAVVSAAQGEAIKLRVDLATSFDCPLDGTVPMGDVRRVLHEALSIAPDAEIALCDTTGRADPLTVKSRFETAMQDAPGTPFAFHGHDTFGMGVANALYAYEAGVRVIEGAAAGLGGCPFAPGATGNTATEDLFFAFEQGGISTGLDIEKLLQAADRIAALPGGKTGGHLRIVPRKRAFA